MTDGFQVTVTSDAITVVTEDFTLVFDREKIGVTEFRYENGEAWHNGVESEVPSPILFGPYMDDFTEISSDLLEKNAAIVCHDEEDIFDILKHLLTNAALRKEMGERAQSLVLQQRGVTMRHLEIIDFIIGSK